MFSDAVIFNLLSKTHLSYFAMLVRCRFEGLSVHSHVGNVASLITIKGKDHTEMCKIISEYNFKAWDNVHMEISVVKV